VAKGVFRLEGNVRQEVVAADVLHEVAVDDPLREVMDDVLAVEEDGLRLEVVGDALELAVDALH
jgi:hypothetical protein